MIRRASVRRLAASVLALAFVAPGALASPPDGSDAPPIVLKDLSGASVDTSKLAPRATVLIFGETNHQATRQACADVLDAVRDPGLGLDAAAAPVPVLIVAREVPDTQIKDETREGRFPSVILHDTKRDAFGAYRVLVMPTVVVVDGNGKVVHAMPGFLPRFKEILGGSLKVAAGKETPEQLRQDIEAKASSADPEEVRAERLVRLAHQLVLKGMDDLAEQRFAEAISLAPRNNTAKLGLGDLMLKRQRPADAEPLFRSVLGAPASDQESQAASLGLALAALQRGGDDAKAESSVRAVLEKDASSPRAHYALGLIFEKRGDSAGACAEYRKAAELAMTPHASPE